VRAQPIGSTIECCWATAERSAPVSARSRATAIAWRLATVIDTAPAGRGSAAEDRDVRADAETGLHQVPS